MHGSRPPVSLFAAAAVLGLLGCATMVPWRHPRSLIRGPERDEVLAALQSAYAGRISSLLELIAIEDGAVYEFHYPESLPSGAASWDAVEELRIHRRLFEPENVLPGELPACSWLFRLVATFERESPNWTERPEFYRSASNREGLDPERWRATGASARSECLIETVGETDYRVLNQSEFVVIEDRAKLLGGGAQVPALPVALTSTEPEEPQRDVCVSDSHRGGVLAAAERRSRSRGECASAGPSTTWPASSIAGTRGRRAGGPTRLYFKVQSRGGSLFILAHDLPADVWSLVRAIGPETPPTS
jgi:hypothetical protein